jgi:archaellum component FlaC
MADKKTREEWRRLANEGIRSALGEYTPVDEFEELLNQVDELEKDLETAVKMIHETLGYFDADGFVEAYQEFLKKYPRK